MSRLRVQGIGKRYGQVPALDDIGLDVPRGSRTAVVGPSGSGKTTLLRIIAGFEAPDAGRVTLDGEVLADGARMVPAHRRGIGYVPQDGALFPHLSVAQNVGFGLDRGLPRRQGRIEELMELVELDRRLGERRPHELSGGQQQRVALARTLARQPKLVLLDEPFTALDTGLRQSLRKAVTKVLEATGVTAILVTHDQAEALSFADQVAVLREGWLVQAGPPRELYQHPRDPETAAFLGEALLLPAELGDGWAACALGRIPADTRGQRGTATIMLRPEQIRLAPLLSGGGEKAGVCGQVTEAEFAGAVCTVTVSLAGDHGTPAPGAASRQGPGHRPAPDRLRGADQRVRAGACLSGAAYGFRDRPLAARALT